MFTQSKPAGEAIGGLAKIRWRQTRPRVPDEEVNLIFSCGLGLREPFCHNKEKRNSIHFAFWFWVCETFSFAQKNKREEMNTSFFCASSHAWGSDALSSASARRT
jgi:hypothetical protein